MRKVAAVFAVLAWPIALGGCQDSKLAEDNEKWRKIAGSLTVRLNELELERNRRASIRPDLVPQRLLELRPEIKARLSLHLLDFSGPCPYGAEKMARADLEAGNRNILTGGLNLYRENVRKHLWENYKVLVIDIASCTDGEAIFEFMDAYNAPVKEAIMKGTGKTYSQILTEAGEYRE